MHRFTIASKKKDTLHLRKLPKGQLSSNSLGDWHNYYKEIENTVVSFKKQSLFTSLNQQL